MDAAKKMMEKWGWAKAFPRAVGILNGSTVLGSRAYDGLIISAHPNPFPAIASRCRGRALAKTTGA